MSINDPEDWGRVLHEEGTLRLHIEIDKLRKENKELKSLLTTGFTTEEEDLKEYLERNYDC